MGRVMSRRIPGQYYSLEVVDMLDEPSDLEIYTHENIFGDEIFEIEKYNFNFFLTKKEATTAKRVIVKALK